MHRRRRSRRAPAAPTWLWPAAQALRSLQDVVQLGYYRGILNQLDDIEAAQPECASFAAAMRELARQFQFEAMSRHLAAGRGRRTGEASMSARQPTSILERANSEVVLIVDDVPDNLSVLHDALDESGYTVLVATGGEAALQRADAGLARHRAAGRDDARHGRLRGRASA